MIAELVYSVKTGGSVLLVRPSFDSFTWHYCVFAADTSSVYIALIESFVDALAKSFDLGVSSSADCVAL